MTTEGNGTSHNAVPSWRGWMRAAAVVTPALVCCVAAGDEGATETAQAVVEPESKLNVSIAPFVWLPGLDGTITVDGISANVDLTFADIVDDTDRVFGLMGAVDFEYERFVFQINGVWTTAKQSGVTAQVPAGTLSADIDVNTVWAEFFGGYRVVRHPLDEAPIPKRFLTLDAYIGGRVTWISSDETVTSATPLLLPDGTTLPAGVSRSFDQSETWVDPIIGLRLGMDITEGWAFQVRGDIGGCSSGSNFAWQAAGFIGYRWRYETWSLALYGGWRALGQDYADGAFEWDVIASGPLIGLSIEF